MKTILVLTDFSQLSKVATIYAIGVAKKIEAKIILLSVINASSESNTLMNWKKLENEMVRAAEEDAEDFLKELKDELSDIDISYQSILGFPIENMVNQFVKKNNIDFIVMGTKGATGLKKVLVGSNAVAVINQSSIPVIIVPAETEPKHIRKIAYATDMQNLEKEIKAVSRFAKAFNAPLHVVHIVKDSTKKENEELERNLVRIAKEEQLIRTARYPQIHFHVISNENTTEAVNKFVEEEGIDLLAMFTHQLDFYEKLLGKSVTRQLAFHSTVPMLAFNKTNIDSY